MKLSEHQDFDQAILQAADHFRHLNLRPAIIEKDYYVTAVLRILANTVCDKIIFKGGTSLAKGWNLIQRFSEDIDIFLDPTTFKPPLGGHAINRELKKIRDRIRDHPGLSFVGGQTIGGFGRNDTFSYSQAFRAPGEVANRVLVESGTASGREPSEIVDLNSYLGLFLSQRGLSLGADDEGPFSLRLLHFRRTFVEKMFALHSRVEILKREGRPLGSYARHYYDLFQLSSLPEIGSMLRSAEYGEIKSDYDRISKEYFPKSYFYPDDMSFARSDALYPPPDLSAAIETDYEAQCRVLCYGSYPSWGEVQERFRELRDLL